MKAERRLSANRIRQKTDSEREVDMKETGGDNKKKKKTDRILQDGTVRASFFIVNICHLQFYNLLPITA